MLSMREGGHSSHLCGVGSSSSSSGGVCGSSGNSGGGGGGSGSSGGSVVVVVMVGSAAVSSGREGRRSQARGFPAKHTNYTPIVQEVDREPP